MNGVYQDDGLSLSYEIHGEGEPIVFLHGFSLDRRMWDEQVKYFSKNYKVITYDLQGFGQSSIPRKPYSHYEDLNKLFAHLNIGSAHIVGLSMGGEASIDFAIQYPGKALSLTILDASIGGYPYKEDWQVYAKELGLEQGRVNWLNHRVFEATRKNKEVMVKLTEIVAGYSGWHWLNFDPRQKLTPTAIERLSEIKAPTLILVGKKDLKYFLDQASHMAQNIPNSRLVVIPGVGHMLNMEAPDEVNNLILDHLQ